MAGEWRETTLDQLGRIVTGKTPPSSRPECFGGDIPFVTPTDFEGQRVIEATGRYLTELGAEAVRGSRIPGRAVMVSCIGSDMGKAAVAGRECVTNQQINSIVVESGDDPLFVYYNLSRRKGEIRAAASGSAQPILNKSAFGQFDILLPPPNEQRAIAHILGTLDDKIELNWRMNETLEGIARALFKSWFVDFNPVRAKSEGRDPGLPKHIADLFPDSFEESELGEIPKGWRVGKVGDLTTLSRDSITPGEFPDEPFDHFSIPAFDQGQRPKTERGIEIKSNKFIVPSDAVLVSKLNPRIPRIWLPVVRDGSRAICSTEFLVAVPRPGVSREFLYSSLSSDAFAGVFETLVTGTSGSHQRVKREGLLAMDAVIPAEPVIHHFAGLVRALLGRIIRGRDECQALAALRETLLPILLSGQIRVGKLTPPLRETAENVSHG